VTHPLSSSAPNPGDHDPAVAQSMEQPASNRPAISSDWRGSSAAQNQDSAAKSPQ